MRGHKLAGTPKLPLNPAVPADQTPYILPGTCSTRSKREISSSSTSQNIQSASLFRATLARAGNSGRMPPHSGRADWTMESFDILIFFCLVSSFTTCALGFYVYGRNPGSLVNRLFLASMIGATYWALGEFFFWMATSASGAAFWLKFSAFWPVVIAVTAHFILVYSDHPLALPEEKRLLAAILYLPSLFFSLVNLCTDETYYVMAHPGHGFIYVPNVTSTLYQLESLFVILIMAVSLWAGISAWLHAGSLQRKRQVRYTCLALGTAIGFGAISGVLLPLFDIQSPNFVFIGIFLFSLIITRAISRYGLFTLTTEAALPEILRTMPDSLLLIGRDGRIITVNESAEATFRSDRSRMQGELATVFLPEAPYLELVSQVEARGTVLDFEVVLDPQAHVVMSIAGALVRDPDGAPAGVVLIIRDISSRKMQERALRVANEKISLLTHLTRHDINNLVTGLSGYLLLLEETNTQAPESTYVRTAIELVEKISRHLRFSSEFLHIGTYQPDWQPLRLMAARATNDLPHEGIQITTDLPPIEIYADPLSVKVFYNLLENAVRHGVNLTAISLSAVMQENGECVIFVEDNGGGIPTADKERVFEYGVGKHTGFGLAFARDILEVTGISIRETGIPGTGARFEIHVPPGTWRILQKTE